MKAHLDLNCKFLFLLLFSFLISKISLSQTKKSKPNLLDKQYRIFEYGRYPLMTSDMKGFESDCDRAIFIDLINVSIYRGIGYGGYEVKLSSKRSITGLLGISYWPDIISWTFNNTDAFLKHDKTKLNNGIHINSWQWSNKGPNFPGPVLGLEHHVGLDDDIFHGLNVKVGYMFHNYTQNMIQILDTSSIVPYGNQLVHERSIRVDQHVLHLGLGYKKMTRQNVFFDGGITLGLRFISYNIKLSQFNEVYKAKKSTAYNYVSHENVSLDEIFVPDENGRKPFQLRPTIMIQGRLGFGFSKKKIIS